MIEVTIEVTKNKTKDSWEKNILRFRRVELKEVRREPVGDYVKVELKKGQVWGRVNRVENKDNVSVKDKLSRGGERKIGYTEREEAVDYYALGAIKKIGMKPV